LLDLLTKSLSGNSNSTVNALTVHVQIRLDTKKDPTFLLRNGVYYSFNRHTLFKDCLEENLIILLCIFYLLITKKSINFIHLFVDHGLNSSILFKMWLKGMLSISFSNSFRNVVLGRAGPGQPL